MFFINGSRGGVFFLLNWEGEKMTFKSKKLFCFNMTRDDVDQEDVHMS